MSDNQNINIKNPVSFSKQDVSQTKPSSSDEQTIADVLKELEEQEKEIITQKQSVSSEYLNEEPTQKNVGLLSDENQENPPSSISLSSQANENDEKLFDILKKAKLEYEKTGQSEDEQKIIGAGAIETYLNWVKEAREALKSVTTDNRQKILDLVPKRIHQQIEGKLIKATEKLIKPQTKKGDEKLQERIRRIDERIKKLNQERSEYLEELLPLETKKSLIKEEIKNSSDKILESDTALVGENEDEDNEKQEQKRSVQDLVSKSSFKNKAPVVSPRKEETSRLKKAGLAKEVEEEIENPPEGESGKVEKSKEKETIKKKTEKKHFYTDEQLHTADTLRKEFWENLSSLTVSEWYQSPTKNRDFVNKQIIKLTEALSNKTPDQIDMEDIQTARLFMFNKAPRKVLKHPAFLYTESFYNYQSFQGCTGINLERTDLEQKDTSVKTDMSSMLENNTDKKFSTKQESNENLNKKDNRWGENSSL